MDIFIQKNNCRDVTHSATAFLPLLKLHFSKAVADIIYLHISVLKSIEFKTAAPTTCGRLARRAFLQGSDDLRLPSMPRKRLRHFGSSVKLTRDLADSLGILFISHPDGDFLFTQLLPTPPQFVTPLFSRFRHCGYYSCDATLRRNIIRRLFYPKTPRECNNYFIRISERSKPCFCAAKTRCAPLRRNSVACQGGFHPGPLALPLGFPLVIHGRAFRLHSFGEAGQ